MVDFNACAIAVAHPFEGDAVRNLFLLVCQVHRIQSFQYQEPFVHCLARVAIEGFGSGAYVGVQPVEGAVRVRNELSGYGGNIAYGTDGKQRYPLSPVAHGNVGNGEMRFCSIVHYIEACHGTAERDVQPHVCPHAVFPQVNRLAVGTGHRQRGKQDIRIETGGLQ